MIFPELCVLTLYHKVTKTYEKTDHRTLVEFLVSKRLVNVEAFSETGELKVKIYMDTEWE